MLKFKNLSHKSCKSHRFSKLSQLEHIRLPQKHSLPGIMKFVRLDGQLIIHYSYVLLNPFSLGFSVVLVREKDSEKDFHQSAFFLIHICGRRRTTEPYPLGSFYLTDLGVLGFHLTDTEGSNAH